MPRIHIPGASGSGTTTLGVARAPRRGCPHDVAADYLWVETDPPCTTLRPPAERLALLVPRLQPPDWVFTGSAPTWATPREPLHNMTVFLHLDPALRMARLRAREAQRRGSRIGPGGDTADGSRESLERAESYDTAGPEQRSRSAHEPWPTERTCPVRRLDSSAPVDRLLRHVLRAVSAQEPARQGPAPYGPADAHPEPSRGAGA